MPTGDLLLVLLLQIGLIMALSRIMGWLCSRLRQPQVMGEMIAGIMLGPSLFGLLAPRLWSAVFPEASINILNILSQVGVIFFLFLIGLDLDPKLIRSRGHEAVIISHASIIAPFLLGAVLVLLVYPQLFNDAPAMRFSAVALFIGASMSITAFPVLARILTERNLHKSKVGAVAITCAAVDDITAWCMLAVVVGVARARGVSGGLITSLLAGVYVAVMYLLIRPLLRRCQGYFDRSGRVSQHLLAGIILLVLASAYATERIGIHALFGAFLMGAIMPKGTRFVRALTEKIEDFTVVFLLPIFFAYTGLRTQIGVLNSPLLWTYALLFIAVASLGKLGGSAIAARLVGLQWREAIAIGTLMNTRGLMELVILNVGLNLGVITVAVFAMMVIMAIVTTALTTPVLHWVYPASMEWEKRADQARVKAFTVLVPVSLPESAGPLVRLAQSLAPLSDAPRQIIALYLRRPSDRIYRTDLDEAEVPIGQGPLASVIAGLPVEPIAFTSRDIPSDIARVARIRQADIILMGYHKPVFGQAILAGTVHRVLTGSDNDVAIFVNRGYESHKPILVPYLGGKHDRLALELAGSIARSNSAAITVLHVVPPDRATADKTLHAQSVVQRTFADPKTSAAVQFKVIHDPSPAVAVVRESSEFGLVVIGVEEQWGLESQLFGWRQQWIANQCPVSMLIVRKHARLGLPPDPQEDSAAGEPKITSTDAASVAPPAA